MSSEITTKFEVDEVVEQTESLGNFSKEILISDKKLAKICKTNLSLNPNFAKRRFPLSDFLEFAERWIMNLIFHKKRPNSSHVSPTPKMSRVTSTNVHHLPQTSRSNSTSTNRFVALLSLRHSLQANRIVLSFSQTSQSPNTFIPPTRKIGTQSTTETIPTCSAPSIETPRTHKQPEAPSRTLPNQGAQYGPSSDNLDQPPSCHPGFANA
ncbi:Uncharacterized protein Fot_53074 [Forsythia ovata]|uniref:Uncharacterized protein n=1 Tax=Forsythia ovata TaxID=205694 RepID=A0ABD1PJ76_9LAMI